jgi:hypothetical protein
MRRCVLGSKREPTGPRRSLVPQSVMFHDGNRRLSLPAARHW